MAVWVIGGVAGSGKTTLGKRLAERLGCSFLDADDFHPPANLRKMASGQPLEESDREAWLEALSNAVQALGNADAVVAFPALKRAHRERFRKAAPAARFLWLRADLSLVQRRLAQRGGFFPYELAASQFAACEADPAAEVLDAGLPLEELVEKAWNWSHPDSSE
jgi:gluconokinase